MNRPSKFPLTPMTLTGVLALLLAVATSASAGVIAQTPLFLTTAVDPRVMLLLSRDEQLSIKAYSDFSDLNGDGTIDTTYVDAINYDGYFSSNFCYTYTNARFEPAALATGTNSHDCAGASGRWSGNFLNWATMTRLDIIRKILYGGYRYTDTTAASVSSAGLTVLERAPLPHDVHAFVKVYNPGNTTEMLKRVPYSQTTISICNLTGGTTGKLGTLNPISAPLMRVAKNAWPRWDASEITQCYWGSGTQPNQTNDGLTSPVGPDLNVRVKVCSAGYLESNCRAYPHKTLTGVQNLKPAGLLQNYGEGGSPMRLGLMTGSWQKNKSGGVLRRNISRLYGNATATQNEIDTDGLFINPVAPNGSATSAMPATGGIIGTLNQLRIASYDMGTNNYQYSCNSPGLLSFNDGQCVDWGNPISEMYLEALRYFAGKTSATTGFNANDSGFLTPTLPQLAWTDPTPAGDWCAKNSIIAISAGPNSFDRDALNNDLGIDATNITNSLGSLEGISGSYLIGSKSSATSTTDGQCTGKTLTNLAEAQGICPEQPTFLGGYHIAGLGYYARTHDLRSDRTGNQNITTYSITAAETQPSIDLPVEGGKITLLPACQANSSGSATLSTTTGWRACVATDMKIEGLNYSNGKLVSGMVLVTWEDSTWGADHDMDGIERLGFCVGSACAATAFTNIMKCPTQTAPTTAATPPSYSTLPAVTGIPTNLGANQVAVVSCTMQAQAGHTLAFGFTITGSTSDGVKINLLRPGGANFNMGAKLPSTATTNPQVTTFTAGTSTAKLLQDPLWYAAKYGAFTESDTPSDNNVTNDQPNHASEWDSNGNGVPDGYFRATNPAALTQALNSIFNVVSAGSASASAIASNSTRLDTNTMVYQARFHSGDWSGHLLAYTLDTNLGTLGSLQWDAADELPTHANRHIYTLNTNTNPSPKGVEFLWANLSTAQRTALNTLQGTADSQGTNRVGYLRGDDSYEQDHGGTFRTRSNLLGDIVNSDPWFVGTEDYGYSVLPGAEGAAYANFRASSAFLNRRKMLYIGANDGMLHGFDAVGGAEQFAYVPNAVFSNLSLLTSPNYRPGTTTTNPIAHQYFVDGSPRAADAYIDPAGGSNKQWKTILLSGLGAGGRSVFALDITNPDSFGPGSVLWEFSNANDADLGYTLPQPSLVRLYNGQWGAVVANGYNSDNGRAVLFILDAGTGAVIRKIDTGVGGNTVIAKNGLSAPVAADVDNDRIADYIYAGDLAGNLWKFDIRSTSASSWGVYGSAPLFTACSPSVPNCGGASNATNDAARQPITGKPEVGGVGSDQSSGVMVYFGTGKYFETGDNNVGANPQMQTFYGLWDDGSAISSRASLQSQTIVYQGTGTNSSGYSTSFDIRLVSKNAINYATQRGWYMDLKSPNASNGQGERVVSSPMLLDNRVLFVTLIPLPNACDFGGTSWLMEVDAVTGQNLGGPAIDVLGGNGSGTDRAVDGNDTVVNVNSQGDAVSGKSSTIGIMKPPSLIDSPAGKDKLFNGTNVNGGNNGTDTTLNSSDRPPGRQSWVQIR